MPTRSIRAPLYAAFAVLLALLIGLGVIGSQRLEEVNRASEVIRDHWLEDTRILGDLSNYMSDYRTAEAARLLSREAADLAANGREIDSLAAVITRSQRAWEAIPQEPAQAQLYRQFAAQWSAYQAVAARVLALGSRGQDSAGISLYMNDSRRSFDRASDTLASLTDQTVLEARTASLRAAQAYRRARLLIFTAMLLAVALLIGVIAYIRHSILNPLLQLADRMRALAAHDTGNPIPGIGRADEVGEMARAVGVFRDNAVALINSERRSIEQAAALERALQNEQLLTAQQRNFVSMTSHEFRTPLTIIDGQAQRLIRLSERSGAGDVAERASRIRSAVRRMTGIMDSLLGGSRLFDGQGVYQPCPLDPAALLREACQAHREASRGANVIEEFGTLPQTIHGDPKLLFHAFSNLISNAVKYSPPGSPVVVSACVEGDSLLVRVRDHGIGVPARDRARLFQRYFRGTNATGVAGTGVGLHLVSMVVALHQGEVFAESLEGVGSSFVVRLPLTGAGAAPAAPDVSGPRTSAA